jgi:hypothetical protein
MIWAIAAARPVKDRPAPNRQLWRDLEGVRALAFRDNHGPPPATHMMAAQLTSRGFDLW